MRNIAMTLSASALLLAASLTGLSAHQVGGPQGSMMQGSQGPQGQMMQGNQRPRGQMMDSDRSGRNEYGPDYMMEGGMPGFSMMAGAGMMGHGMSHMVLILMDTDGDGALSQEEFLAVQKRMFAAMDLNDDGKLTFEEMQHFMDGEWATPDDDQ